MGNAQAQFTRTAAAAEYIGLINSVHKTEYMTINCNPQPPMEVYGQPVRHVSNFKYRGSMMASGIIDCLLEAGTDSEKLINLNS